MSWRDSKSVSFTRLDIVAHVPSESGVYAILDGDCCMHVGDSWNLKARLLEVANVIADSGRLTVMYELCPEDQLALRRSVLSAELLRKAGESEQNLNPLPGLWLRSQPPR
jgi:hypothetical protein